MKSIEHLIPSKEKKFIEELENLLDFIYEELSNYDFKYREVRLKKLFLYQALGDLFTKASAIFELLKESKTIACNILLRSTAEAFINIEYVFADKSDDNLLKLYLDDSEDRVKLGNKVKDFIHRNPNFKAFGGQEDSEQYWDSYSNKAKDEIKLLKKLKKKPNLKPLPNLKDRALFIDTVRKTNIEWWCISLYWLFSQDTHSTMRGLDNHFNRSNEQIFFELEGDIKDIEKAAVTTYMVLFSVIDKFFDKFKFDKTKLKPFKKIYKEYVNRAGSSNK